MSAVEYADLPVKDAMRALVIEWHDANEAGCCDDDNPPYCPESKVYAHGCLATVARMDHQGNNSDDRSIPAQVVDLRADIGERRSWPRGCFR
ncbi:hypothetical protein A5742_09960 [Mycolicibacterium fortuitum]|uniref:Uncharacterized protein n=1 Tax=Mycolicibacterium fortuitum TaxID=1766 RepID=A0ABD6QF29_MYCFO|nr:hypothetical protein [Mycolicibacterium fortuitum]OMC37261.1 hypothetical protein A5742_09960 [Mycolicibacterium fortuitum]